MSVNKPNNLAIDQRVTITLSGLSNERAKKQKLLFSNQSVPKDRDIANIRQYKIKNFEQHDKNFRSVKNSFM